MDRDKIKLDDATQSRAATRRCTDNQQYWTNRWADQMNYRYWKERCQAEQTDEAVLARQLFYEGRWPTRRAISPRPPTKFKEGLESGRRR